MRTRYDFRSNRPIEPNGNNYSATFGHGKANTRSFHCSYMQMIQNQVQSAYRVSGYVKYSEYVMTSPKRDRERRIVSV
jgi:hypothetical protein